MKTMIINGKEIKTNYETGSYSVWNGYDIPKTYKSYIHCPFAMSTEKFLYQLVDQGYTRIRFVETTTAVRGYHEIYAFVKR